MKLNNLFNRFSLVSNWVAKTMVALVAIVLFWHAVPVSISALAAPPPLVASDAGNQVKGAADEVRARSKELIRDTKSNVQKTADRNATKVDQADDEGSFVERKAQRDRARIQRRAEEDASRTEKAVDDSMNGVKGIVDNIKDAFGG